MCVFDIMGMPCVWVTEECIGLDPLEVEIQMCVRWPSMAQRLQTECEFWDQKLSPFGSMQVHLSTARPHPFLHGHLTWC